MMPLGARRTFRLASVVALSLALAYGLDMPLPFFAPLFGFLLTTAPAPPMGLKALLSLCRVVIVTLGVGLMLTPLLGKYPVSALADHCGWPVPRHDHQHRRFARPSSVRCSRSVSR